MYLSLDVSLLSVSLSLSLSLFLLSLSSLSPLSSLSFLLSPLSLSFSSLSPLSLFLLSLNSVQFNVKICIDMGNVHLHYQSEWLALNFNSIFSLSGKETAAGCLVKSLKLRVHVSYTCSAQLPRQLRGSGYEGGGARAFAAARRRTAHALHGVCGVTHARTTIGCSGRGRVQPSGGI